jgi:hypothetical protein
MNRLHNNRVYLCGGMDRVADGGAGWRKRITPSLKEMGVAVLDPCCKPIDCGIESDLARETIAEWKAAGEWDLVVDEMKLLRCVDLRMVDISDFLIVYLNLNDYAFGTIEELVTANRQKKPILVMVEQTKHNAPSWLFGMIPHQHIFSSFEDLMQYLQDVNSGKETNHYRRWFFFDYDKMYGDT